MASTYSTNLAIELIGTGDQSGTWGTTTNTNLGTLIEQAISGYVTQAITDGADTTITIPNGATGVARNMALELTGTLTAARNLIVPANKKLYFIYNNTTGGYAVTVKVSGQTGVSVPNGKKMVLVSNGTDVVAAVNYFSALSAGGVTVDGSTVQTNGMYLPTTNTLAWSTNSSERMRLDSSGNLGIGTTSPVTKLNVASAAGSPTGVSVGAIRVYETTNNYGLNIGGDGTYGYIQGIRGATSSLGYNDLVLQPNSGNVGIGVTPSAWSGVGAALQVGTSAAIIGNSVNSSSFISNAYFDGTNYKYIGTGFAQRLSFTSGAYSFQTAASGTAGNTVSFTASMTLDASGNLALGGTTNKITGLSGGGNGLTIQGATAPTLALYDTTNAGYYLNLGQIEADSYLWNIATGIMSFGTNNTERARITSGGEVYIAGTTDQGAYNLQVNGTGVWGAGAYVNGSDERLKDNIQTLDDGLAVVSQLRPVTFQYKSDYSKDRSVQPGFIAQELQQAMANKPYLDGVVQSGPKHLNVAYQNLIPILTKAIQEQQSIINDLRSRVAQLETK